MSAKPNNLPPKTAQSASPLFKSFGSIASSDVFCFDFVTDVIKAARSRTLPGRKVISEVCYKDVRGKTRDEIVSAIRECARLTSKGAQGIAITVVPSSLVITKNIEIPSQDPKEIKDIINLQAGRLTPYAREEVIIDYIRIGTFRQSYTKLLLIIVNKDVVKKQLAFLNDAGLKVNKVLLASEMMGLMVYQYLKLELQDLPYCIIHADFASTDFGVYVKERQVFLRSISIGAYQLVVEKDKFQGRFIEELKKSFDAYQAEDIESSPSRVIFTGAVSELKDLEIMMLDAFRIPVKMVGVSDIVPRADSLSKESLYPRDVSMFAVAAPLFKTEAASINLIPDEVKAKFALEERGRDIIKTGILAMTLILFVCAIFLVDIYLKSEYYRKLSAKFKVVNEEASQIEKDFSKARIIRNYLAVRGLSLNVLSEIYDVTPSDISLTSIRLKEKGGGFSLRGEASAMSVVFNYVNDLEKSAYFKNVKTKYTSKKRVDNEELVDFEIACALKGSGEDTP